MSQTQLQNIEELESDLWAAADQLRANSKLTSSEYCMPVLGIIFLRHATNRYDDAVRQIAADQAAGKMPKRSPMKADFLKRRALMLPKEARYDELCKLPKGTNFGTALVKAMDAIERDFEPLLNVLPKDYDKFESDLLEDILRIFDSDTLRTASGDVFGRIYEYFLMEFAMQGAQDNGEFFTPPSLVQTIVNVIEPDHGIVFDCACGSAGMFVQSSHFIERRGQHTCHCVTFFGQEKTATTIRLAKMNRAVHGLEGDIREANTFYEDVHRLKDGKPLFGNCDFVNGYTASAEQEQVGPKFLRITDIVPAFIDWSAVPYCPIEDDRLEKFRLREGDIVIARTGATVGYAKRLHKRHPETVFASYLVRLRPKADVESLILGVFVESQAFKDYVKSRVGGAAQPNANAQVLAAAEILVPKPTIQREFRDFVEPQIDQREILQTQNQKLRAARDLLLQRLMSGEVAV